ncbi:competence protein CoiA [Gottfriedia solisilvae]|uniref:competence protein CoiA n=1 Tax=Gottfriedia solisilvae TaxID=1516104 RepID=UPI003D2ED3EC
MINALDKFENQINLFEMKSSTSSFEIKKLGPFKCPICKKQVLLKLGMKRRAHFAHISVSECENARKESKEHYDGKYDLYEYFKRIGGRVYIEKYLESIQQRPDILVEFNNYVICIEYQCSIIPLQQIIDRTKSYHEISLKVLWILGMNMHLPKSKFTYALNSLAIYCLGNSQHSTLCFYDPSKRIFVKLSSLIAFSPTIFVGMKSSYKIENCTPSQLISQVKIDKNDFVTTWCALKKGYRKKQHLYYKGSFYPLKEHLYTLQIDYLPAVIGVPLACNYLLNEHCIVWQGILFLNFIHSKKIGEMIFEKEISDFFFQQIETGIWRVNVVSHKDISNLENCVENYIHFLDQIGIVKQIKNGKIMKIADAIIPKSFQHALDEDCLAASTAFELLFHTLTDNQTLECY